MVIDTEELKKYGFTWEDKSETWVLDLHPEVWGYMSVAEDFSYGIYYKHPQYDCDFIPGRILSGMEDLQNLYYALTGTKLTVNL